jgi:hypothetical protein
VRPNLEAISLDSARTEIEIMDPSYSLSWTVANPSVADLVPVSGDPWRFDLVGHAVGSTSVVFRLLQNGTPRLTSASIPVVVGGSPAGDTTPSFVLKKNGIWTVIVLDGAIMDGCSHVANPGRFEAGVGEVTDLYSVRVLDAACAQNALSDAQYSIAFVFEDDCIARTVNHPEHWDEKLIFHIEGVAVGSTTVKLYFLKNNAVDFVSPPIPVSVHA